MAYATLEDLIERAGAAEIRQIADRDRDGTPDPEVIAAAIEDATNRIDGHLATKYSLPLPSVPGLVISWAVSIARYILHRDGAPKHVRDDFDDAIKALEGVARGLSRLPVPEGEAPPAPVAGPVIGSHPPRVFTPDRLRGWRP